MDRLDLPGGALLSCAVDVGARIRELPVSFDQRRHVGQGQRPGSWLAVALSLSGPVDLDNLVHAWLVVVARHGTLRSVFSHEPDPPGAEGERIALHGVEITGASWVEHEVAHGQRPSDVVREVLDDACAPFARPSHRLVLAGAGTARPSIVIGLDHAHADAWSLLVLARDLSTCLDDVAAGRAPGVGLPPAFVC